jgi:hypothetical protein
MNEIEEFLKRAAAMRARAAAKSATPPTRTAPPAPPPMPPIPKSLVQDAEIVEAEPVSGDDVAELVAKHLDSRSFLDRASRLGSSVKSTDEVIESHLHETFEHRLGQLGATTARAQESTLDDDERAAAIAAAKGKVAPTSLAAQLRSKNSLRNAIILSEILNPPNSRW